MLHARRMGIRTVAAWLLAVLVTVSIVAGLLMASNNATAAPNLVTVISLQCQRLDRAGKFDDARIPTEDAGGLSPASGAASSRGRRPASTASPSMRNASWLRQLQRAGDVQDACRERR